MTDFAQRATNGTGCECPANECQAESITECGELNELADGLERAHGIYMAHPDKDSILLRGREEVQSHSRT